MLRTAHGSKQEFTGEHPIWVRRGLALQRGRTARERVHAIDLTDIVRTILPRATEPEGDRETMDIMAATTILHTDDIEHGGHLTLVFQVRNGGDELRSPGPRPRFGQRAQRGRRGPLPRRLALRSPGDSSARELRPERCAQRGLETPPIRCSALRLPGRFGARKLRSLPRASAKGYWRDGQIVDCPADLTQEIFDHLDAALDELIEITRVEGGETAEDYDTGRIVEVSAQGDEARVTVSWDSGVTTTQPASLLRREGTRPVTK